jgi:hypothetical protein
MKLSDDLKVSLVTGACIIALAVFSKALQLQLDFISLYGPLWMFIVYIATKEVNKKSVCSNALFWSIAIILVTLAIMVVYAV